MLPDFEVIVKRFETPEDITIIPVSDVHCGAREFMEQPFLQFIDTVAKTPNVFLTLGGDLINNATRSSVSNIFDETMRPSEQKRWMAKALEPVRDKILCSVTGNHERRSTKDVDDDPAYDIMCKLDIEDRHRDGMAFVKLGFRTDSRHDLPNYVVCVTHGAGGGAMTGSAVNKFERFGYALDGVDALIVGHTHKPFVTQPGKIVFDSVNDCVSVRPFKVVCATSWLEYSGGYAVQKMLLPSTHCLHTITLRGNKKEMVVTM